MIRILKYIKAKEWLMLLIATVFITAQVGLDLKIPDYMSNITMVLLSADSTVSQVLVEGGYMLACALGSLVLAVLTAFIMTRIATGLSARLRRMQFEKVTDFSLAEVNKFSTSSLTTRTSNDVMQVQMLVNLGGQFLIKAPIMAIWAMSKILNKDLRWTAVTGGAVLAIIIMLVFIAVVALPSFKKIQGMTDKLNKLQRETITGIRVVRAYNAESYQEEKFEKANNDITKTQLFANRAMQIMQPGMQFVFSTLSLAIYIIGAIIIRDVAFGGSTVDAVMVQYEQRAQAYADMLVFSEYAMQVIMAFMLLIFVFILAPRALVSARRILEVLDVKPSITDGQGVGEISDADKGTIEFKNVSFKYPDADGYALKDINLKINKGETVAFIGATGSGKTTLINLLPRFYDTTDGQVLVNGADVKQYKLDELQNHIGYVSQKSVLFSGDIKANINLGDNGKEITESDIYDALDIAQGKSFVEKLPKKVDSYVAQGGTNFSGGQKQRLSIARGIAKKADIMIFDDSFSALDYKTDRNLRQALKDKTAGVTNLIVAQRIGTIADADKIVVLENGEMVGCDTHKNLLNTCDIYKEIALSQLSKEEL